jgi:hypothetical protein
VQLINAKLIAAVDRAVKSKREAAENLQAAAASLLENETDYLELRCVEKGAEKLQAAAENKTVRTLEFTFTPEQWEKFGMDNLSEDCYISVTISGNDQFNLVTPSTSYFIQDTGPTCCHARIHTHTRTVSLYASLTISTSLPVEL